VALEGPFNVVRATHARPTDLRYHELLTARFAGDRYIGRQLSPFESFGHKGVSGASASPLGENVLRGAGDLE